MFTGLIDHCGIIQKIEKTPQTLRLWIECQFDDIVEGESIAVDGACLTAILPKPKQFCCELSPETVVLTIAKQYEKGTLVNLERSLRLSDRLGGHFVSGHAVQVGHVKSILHHEEFTEVNIGGVRTTANSYLIPKGSIAVNGVSLTINAVLEDGFSVMLIPHTLQRTNLHQLQVGSLVNLEFDLLAKMVQRQLEYLKTL